MKTYLNVHLTGDAQVRIGSSSDGVRHVVVEDPVAGEVALFFGTDPVVAAGLADILIAALMEVRSESVRDFTRQPLRARSAGAAVRTDLAAMGLSEPAPLRALPPLVEAHQVYPHAVVEGAGDDRDLPPADV